mmetsp:Transcript_17304/g.33780  ORF Transcript_17304/g.33780 Transcript_17304/m.33780 type:complete len:205 (-) Transcript_17304:526-1140(-)
MLRAAFVNMLQDSRVAWVGLVVGLCPWSGEFLLVLTPCENLSVEDDRAPSERSTKAASCVRSSCCDCSVSCKSCCPCMRSRLSLHNSDPTRCATLKTFSRMSSAMLHFTSSLSPDKSARLRSNASECDTQVSCKMETLHCKDLKSSVGSVAAEGRGSLRRGSSGQDFAMWTVFPPSWFLEASLARHCSNASKRLQMIGRTTPSS